MLIPFSMVILLSIDDYLHFKIDSVNFTKITPVLPTKENLKTPIYESFLNNKKEIYEARLRLVKKIGRYCLPLIIILFSLTFNFVGMSMKYSSTFNYLYY